MYGTRGGKKDKRATADVALQDFVYLTQAGFAVGFQLQVLFLIQHAHIVVVSAADWNTTSKFYCYLLLLTSMSMKALVTSSN